MKSCVNVACKRSIPGNALHCPYCGQTQVKKKSPPVFLVFVGGVLFLAAGAVIFRNILPGASPTISPNITPSNETGEQTALSATTTSIPEILTVISTLPNETPNFSEPTRTENPMGKIVYTCQVFKDNNRNQICIMNADGSDQRRLTNTENANSWYPSLAPDGNTIVFSSNQTGEHEIYEMDLNGNETRLTSLGELYAPEISPNGQQIVFTNASGTYSSIWMMDRDGNNPHVVYQSSDSDALDPTWSPNGNKILFAIGQRDKKKLYTINWDQTELNTVNDSFTTRGRSDWSPDGRWIAGYTGGTWKRIVSIMNSDGSGLKELYKEGNVQAPSFSPNSQWLAFTGYIDNMGNDDGCEIYILQLVDSQLKRLTDNDYCDWQPRWGP